jgi:signal transduction histidine kinase
MIRTIALVFAGSALFLGGVVTGTANDNRMVFAGLSLIVIAVLLSVIVRERVSKHTPRRKTSVVAETKESAQALYQMATALGEITDYQKLMQIALDLGFLGMKDLNPNARDPQSPLVGMIMLFRNEELRVVSSRGLARQDAFVKVQGNAGVLARALDRAEPTLGEDAHDDPELSYFVGFQNVRSVLALPLRATYQSFGLLVFGSNKPDAFDRDHMELLAAIATQATMALQNAMLYESLRKEKERLVEVEEEARKKLARDLHDGPTQTISALVMRLDIIARQLMEPKAQRQHLADELKKIEVLARRSTKEMRHMLFTLRPLVLESQGLGAALNQLSAKMKETFGTAVDVEVDPAAESMLSEQQQGMLFYIMEEATGNARKYSQAPKIVLKLFKEHDYAVAEVSDDGVGFDVDGVLGNYTERGSLGMINMQERAASIGGQWRIESRIGYGTRVTVVVAGKGRGRSPATTSPTAEPNDIMPPSRGSRSRPTPSTAR